MSLLADPNVAYLLLTIGLLGILAEFFHPGAAVPGITGAAALILAFVALAGLPVNWVAVVLIIVGVGLVGADLAAMGTRYLAIAGVVVFVLGSLLLYAREPFSVMQPYDVVNVYLIAVVSVCMTLFFLGIGKAVRRARGEPVASGAAALIGRRGVAETTIAPRGMVRVDSESWSAQLENGESAVNAGQVVEIVDVQGVMLRVRHAHRPDTAEGEDSR